MPQLSVNSLGKLEGVYAFHLLFKSLDLGFVVFAGFPYPLKRGLGLVIQSFDFGAYALFLNELHGGLKEILKQPQLVLVEAVDGLLGLHGVIAIPAQDLTDMGVVFLFHMAVVIFLVFTAPGKLHPGTGFKAEGQQGVVDELFPIV